MERSYLGKIEAGRVNTSIDKLEKITRGLGLSLFEFFGTFDATPVDAGKSAESASLNGLGGSLR